MRLRRFLRMGVSLSLLLGSSGCTLHVHLAGTYRMGGEKSLAEKLEERLEEARRDELVEIPHEE